MKKRFADKKIILGVCGGIAAYKSCYLLRELVSKGAEVRVVMTPSACQFIQPLTFSTLSGNEVIVEIFPESQKYGCSLKTWHIELANWADLMIIAPATINSIAKIANGFADNALTTLASAARVPILFAPAADSDMYLNPANRENIEKLETKFKSFIVEGESGYLASGLEGIGRMADIRKILDAVELCFLGKRKDLKNARILVTGGPTYEDIDPVRFIGNRSSGKMGCEIAKAAFLRGAKVCLITGPTKEYIYPEIETINVRSALQMKMAIEQEILKYDLLIMSAAVADFRPKYFSNFKIKKETDSFNLELEKNPDILKELNIKNKHIIGFALETDNEKDNAIKKLQEKKLDMIVLNSAKEPDSGFEVDTNKASFFFKDGRSKTLPLLSKFELANYILDEAISFLNPKEKY